MNIIPTCHCNPTKRLLCYLTSHHLDNHNMSRKGGGALGRESKTSKDFTPSSKLDQCAD